jgi:hypothetical protein
MENLIKLASKFRKLAVATNHYTQIVNVYNASKSLAGAAKSVPDLKPQADAIQQSAARLLWNADNYGVSAQTSAKYHGVIQDKLDGLRTSLKNLDINMLARWEPEIEQASDVLETALHNYIPQSISAAKPKQTQAPVQTPESGFDPTAPFAFISAVPPTTAPTAAPTTSPEIGIARTVEDADKIRGTKVEYPELKQPQDFGDVRAMRMNLLNKFTSKKRR